MTPNGRTPNVLMILVDQMRADHMRHAGDATVHTPALDGLARGGAPFDRAYVNAPVCMPSRATLATGRTPRGHGVRTNGIELSDSLPTLAASLVTHGYRTASFGKLHLRPYERYPDVPEDAATNDESHQAWATGRRDRVHLPYYGFQEVALTIGHGASVEGNYALDLRRDAPEAWARLREGPSPSPLRAEGCGTYPLPEALHHTRWVADRTIDFLESLGRETPFFVQCSFPDPHHPYVPPTPWDRRYGPHDVPEPIGAPADLDAMPPHFRDMYRFDAWVSGRRRATAMPQMHLQEIRAHTYGMVSLLDAHIARVLEALDRNGHRNDTIVVFLSDHGDLLGDHGLLNKGPFHYQGLVRVPMIWSWPGRVRPGRRNALASLLDVVPTLLELLGIDGLGAGRDGNPVPGVPAQPPELPGVSLAPVLAGASEAVQAHVLIEDDEDYLGLRLRTMITDGARITTYTDRDGPAPYGELFDLREDPHERRNLWHEPTHTRVKTELLAGLHHALVRTDGAPGRRMGHA